MEMFLSSLDLLHKPGLSKAWIIYIGTRVICIFYENMHLFLTSLEEEARTLHLRIGILIAHTTRVHISLADS